MKFLLLQTLRLASQATSLYTREAHYRPTVHLKGVTHYTLQGKACEKEYEQMPVLLLFFRQVKPALWNAPLGGFFCSLISSLFVLLFISHSTFPNRRGKSEERRGTSFQDCIVGRIPPPAPKRKVVLWRLFCSLISSLFVLLSSLHSPLDFSS